MEAKELRLSIVPLASVLLHEEIERSRVTRLVERLGRDRVLKNPPIVTQVQQQGEPRYIVLDGASRTTALRTLGCRDLLVQVVDYDSPELRLESWNHLLLDLAPDDLREALSNLPCVSLVEMGEAEARLALERREILGYLLFGDSRVSALRCPSDLAEQAESLNEVVRAYEKRATLYRISSTALEQSVGDTHRITALMVFPHYTPAEILAIALSGARVPMGITRHIIPGRALRVNLPLDLLESDQTLAAKNAWLDDWLKEKIRDRHVRFYQEPVFLFDE